MLRPLAATAFVLTSLLLPVGALAARGVAEYEETPPLTEEEIAAAKAKGRSGVTAFGDDSPVEVKPFPWKTVGVFAVAALIALPFAARMFKETAGALDADKPSRRRGDAG